MYMPQSPPSSPPATTIHIASHHDNATSYYHTANTAYNNYYNNNNESDSSDVIPPSPSFSKTRVQAVGKNDTNKWVTEYTTSRQTLTHSNRYGLSSSDFLIHGSHS